MYEKGNAYLASSESVREAQRDLRKLKQITDPVHDAKHVRTLIRTIENALEKSLPGSKKSRSLSELQSRKRKLEFASEVGPFKKYLKYADFVHDSNLEKEENSYGDEIYRDGNYRVFVKRVRTATSDVFRVEDHTYKIFIKPISENGAIPTDVPLVITILNQLGAAFTHIISELQRNRHTHNLSKLYVFVGHDDLTNGINLESLSLERPAEELAESILTDISNTLRSHQSLALDSGFDITLKVITVNHARHLERMYLQKVAENYKHFPRPSTPELVGATKRVPTDLKFQSAQNSYDPANTPELPKNSCVIACLTLGLYQAYSQVNRADSTKFKSEAEDFKVLSNVRLSRKRVAIQKTYKQAVLLLCEKMQILAEVLQEDVEGPHVLQNVIQKMSQIYNVQISVYAHMGTERIHREPKTLDRSLPHILLYKSLLEEDIIDHILLIFKPYTLFSHRALPCHLCSKMDNGQAGHKCLARGETSREALQCFTCRRYISNENNPDTSKILEAKLAPHKFCFQESLALEKCSHCNLTAKNKNCLQTHKASKFLCGRGVVCQGCDKFLYLSGTYRTIEARLAEHKCFYKHCPICKEEYDATSEEEHACLVRGVKSQKLKPAIGVYDFEAVCEDGVNSCPECFVKEQKYINNPNNVAENRSDIVTALKYAPSLAREVRCAKHEDGNIGKDFHKVNCAVLAYEDQYHGVFNRICFFSPDMNHKDDCKLEIDYYKFDYLPAEIADKENHLRTNRTQPQNNYNKNKGLPQKSSNFVMDEDFKRQPALIKFMKFILGSNLQNQVFLAHNAQSYDHLFILQAMYACHVVPYVLNNGLKILELTEKKQNIRFIDSMKYLQGSLNNVAKTYSLRLEGADKEGKLDFPHAFNRPENYFYAQNGYPPIETYINFNDTAKQIEEKVQRHKECEGKFFSFQEQLAHYCKADVDLLLRACCHHIFDSYLQCIHFVQSFGDPYVEETKQTVTNYDSSKVYMNSLFHVYGRPFLTLSGYVWGTFRAFCKPPNLYAVNDESGATSIAASKIEKEYALFTAHMHPDEIVHSKYTSLKQKRFGHMWVDIWRPSVGKVTQILGCHFHGHSCQLLRPGVTPDSKNYLGESQKVRRQNVDVQEACLKKFYKVSEVENIWECEYHKLKELPLSEFKDSATRRHAEALRKFLKEHYTDRPLERLAPRDSLRGGKTEVYSLSAEPCEKYELCYVDASSLYPSVCSTAKNQHFWFPIDRFSTLIRPQDIDKLSFEDNWCYYEDPERGKIKVKGPVQLAILPPQDELIPFLPYRVKVGNAFRSVSPACRTCAEKGQTGPCTHSPEKRALIGNYCLDEIAYAVCTFGYKIIKIFEARVSDTFAPIFMDYLKILARNKIKFSGIPAYITSDSEKQVYVDKINEEMEFEGSEALKVSEFTYQPQKRSLAKLMSNSLLGKTGLFNDLYNSKLLKPKFYFFQVRMRSCKQSVSMLQTLMVLKSCFIVTLWIL